MTHGEAAVTGQGTQRAEPALGQGPGLPPRLGVPFVLWTPVPDRRRKDSCAWEPEPPLLRSPNPRRWQAPPAELDALFRLLSPGGLPPRASLASASSLQGCRLLTAWRPSLHLSRLGQVWSSLRVPQTLEKMGEGGPQWPWWGAGGRRLHPASGACPGCPVPGPAPPHSRAGLHSPSLEQDRLLLCASQLP